MSSAFSNIFFSFHYIHSPFLLRIITKDDDIPVETLDAAAAAAALATNTTADPETPIDKMKTIRRSDISLPIEV